MPDVDFKILKLLLILVRITPYFVIYTLFFSEAKGLGSLSKGIATNWNLLKYFNSFLNTFLNQSAQWNIYRKNEHKILYKIGLSAPPPKKKVFPVSIMYFVFLKSSVNNTIGSIVLH